MFKLLWKSNYVNCFINLIIMPFKPSGYNSLSPYFIVDQASDYIVFLQNLFNAEVKRRYDHPDGSLMHAELLIDDSIIMLGQSSDQYPANKHLLHLYVPDVDKVFSKAIKLGCIAKEEPKERQGDPDRRGSFIDPRGNHWSIGTQL